MTLVHWIVPHAGLQPFEQDLTAFNPMRELSGFRQIRIGYCDPDVGNSKPYEISYARALGLMQPDIFLPWAAWETQTLGKACAWVYPCHLDVGISDMVLQPVDQLQLEDAQSRELHALVAGHFQQDGITLHYHSVNRWLAVGEQFAELACSSVAAAQGKDIGIFLPDPGEYPQQTQLARLQTEIQMLLHTHPINEQRAAQGLPVVNSYWLTGAGKLDAMPTSTGLVKLDERLQKAAHDPTAYQNAWQTLLMECQLQASASDFYLTLCGDSGAAELRPVQAGLLQFLKDIFGRSPGKKLRSLL
jgi:hypothetical protein